MSDPERIGILEAQFVAHAKADEVGFARINADTSEIKEALRALSVDIKSSFERVHTRVDEEASKARHSLANATMAAQGDLKGVAAEARANANLALTAAQAAADGVKDAKIWALTGLAGGLAALFAWAAERVMGKMS